MTKFAISPEGADSLRALSETLSASYEDVVAQTNRLIHSLEALTGKLGPYELTIMYAAKEILLIAEEYEASGNQLKKWLNNKAGYIEGLFDLSTDGSDEDPGSIYAPKVKTRPFIVSTGGRSR